MISLKEYSVVPYEDKHYEEVLEIFLDFQMQAKIGTFYNISNGQNEVFYKIYLIDEFKKILKNKYKFVGINKENEEIFGFACFSDRDSSKILDLCFKRNNYKFNLVIKNALVKSFDLLGEGSIYAVLGNREKFDKYVNFVIRVLGVTNVKKMPLGKILVQLR
jgi:hypothetical protein